jgi:predicted amidohydrolase
VIQLTVNVSQQQNRRDEIVSLADSLTDVSLIVLPELWVTGYHNFGGYQRDAEPLNGPTVHALRTLAQRAGAHVVGGTFLERDGEALHNTAVLLSPTGDLLQTYRKAHLMSYLSREAELLTAGSAVSTVDTELGRIGLATCYDIRFPELFRAMVDQGAEIFVVPAAWPEERIEAWELFLRARASENQAYVIGCNGAGSDCGVTLGGRSTVVDPLGRCQAVAGAEASIVYADIDVNDVRAQRNRFPALAHRRRWTDGIVAGR